VRHAACRVEGVRGVEKLFARRTGLQYHVDLHLEVDGWISVDQGHAIATEVRERIRADVHAISDVLVHVEPTGLGIPGTQEGRNAGRQERNSGGQGF
jgi:divalent metal cation (Fe/Co/Zn/Cd) transporter